jgi:dTDP-4-dehydrorhamnose reductase
MKFLVIGCNGMVGHVVGLLLQEKGHDVHGYDENESSIIHSVVGSLKNTGNIDRIIREGKFDSVINCTAVINQFAEEDKARAVFINSYLPHFLEKTTANTPTIVVHRSTDCIFTGSRGGYGLNDTPDEISYYARTKVIGELVNDKDITIRTSLVGPEQDENGIGLLNWFMKQHGEVKGFPNVIWTGLTTIEFAREIEYLVKHKAHGLFQCVPSNAISKYELLKLFDNHFLGNRTLVRAENKKIDKSLIQEIGSYGMIVPSYDIMIDEMVQWIHDHASLYPEYYVN